MIRNVGSIDRFARVSFGMVFIAVALGFFGQSLQSPWGWIGVLPVLTGLLGWCAVYAYFGFSTREPV